MRIIANTVGTVEQKLAWGTFMGVSTLFRVLIHTGAILSVVIKIMILRTVGTVSVFIDILKVTLADTLLQIIAFSSENKSSNRKNITFYLQK